MQAIETKCLGFTKTKGKRIKASNPLNISVTISYDYELEDDENHREAARAFMRKMGWCGEMHGGRTRNGMAWVLVSNDSLCILEKPDDRMKEFVG